MARVPAEPIAIVGIGCRFAGVHDVASFWDVLRDGQETVGEYPGGRFDYLDQVYAAEGPLAGQIATRRGGFLRDVDRFDPGFFEISLREAPLLDPQQRVLLEVAWEAIDDAGLRRDQLAGSQTGVFVGVWTSDYEASINEASDGGDLYATTGTGRYAASGRIAYVLDARGPNLTLDTACSSSLVAVHLACQSLLSGESEVALAGGVNVILRPEITLAYSAANMLSSDGRSKFGDASADGYVRSEGAGVVVLKTLSRAIADEDEIYAVIRGTAVNNDGRSSGLLLAPGQGGQKAVFEAGLRRAGVEPHEVDYVEAHGTGTLRGDPVELSTIGEVVGTATREQPCLVGSVKTNIGHTEGAAGVAAVIKVALALKNQMIPASLHFREPTPLVEWDKYAIRVAAQTTPWPASTHAPSAAISSFGITGTNANAVLGAVPDGARIKSSNAHLSETQLSKMNRPLVFALSAHTQAALTDAARSWCGRMDADLMWPASLVDLAHTSTLRRTQHDVRLAVIAGTREDLRARLSSWVDGDEQPGVVSGRRMSESPRKAVFVYSGQGGQWTGMGRGLYEREPVFRAALDRCDAAIRALTGWSVVEMVLRDENVERMAEHDVVQPVLFALQFALTELWRSLGVEPAAVVGHSLGEVAAAAVTGALSVEDAAAVVCHRSRVMKQVVGRGMMALVELPLDEMRQRIAGAGNLWIGASNGASSTVVSGDIDAVETLVKTFEAEEVFCRRVRTDVASHSGHMEEPRAELVDALRGIQPRRGSIPMYSTTTGVIEDGARFDAEYWGKNLRQPVLFYPAVQQLLADGFDAFVEVNVHPVLSHSVSDSLQRAEREAVVAVSMRRDADEQVSLLSALGTLHVAGYPMDWTRVNPKGAHLRLPTYPWQRERYWFEPEGLPRRRQLQGEAMGGDSQMAVDPGNCLYALQWEDMAASTPLPHGSEAPPGGTHWIVLADESLGRRLSAQLSTAGDTCVTVHAGDQARALDATTFVVNPTNDEHLRAVLERYADRNISIIHAWSASDADDVPSLDTLWDAQARGCFSVGSVVRVLAVLQRPQPTPLWIVTRGGQQVDANDMVAVPTHGGLFGLGRSIAQTHPEIPCANFDLSRVATDDELRTAVQVMRGGTNEQQVAVRGTRRLVARYRRALTRRVSATGVRSDATYLLTGGLGGIGIGAARWLVERGARHLVLVGRKAPSSSTATAIAELESRGAQIRVVAADIAEPSAVTKLIETAQASMPPIAGVLHLAAIVEDALLPNADTEMYRRLMRPKMAGGWNLYQALANQSLDFWVSFSSIAAVVSQPGQGTYAAANASLDGLARYATMKGMPMRSVQWGPWTGVGLSNEVGTQRSFAAYAAQGITEMPLDFGLAILGEAMTREAPVMLGTPIDVTKFLATSGDTPGAAEFRTLTPVPSTARTAQRETNASADAAKAKNTAPAVPNIAEQLASLTPGRPRTALLETHLREQLASILKTSVARIDAQQPLGSLGIDSLMALELVRRLSSATGLKVPATAVFNYPTIAKLAVALEGRLAKQAPAAGSATTNGVASNGSTQNGATSGDTATSIGTTSQPAGQTTGVSADVNEMSDEEALRALTGDFGVNQ